MGGSQPFERVHTYMCLGFPWEVTSSFAGLQMEPGAMSPIPAEEQPQNQKLFQVQHLLSDWHVFGASEQIPFTTFFQTDFFFPFILPLEPHLKTTQGKVSKAKLQPVQARKGRRKAVMRCHQFCFYWPLHFTHSFHFIFLCWYLVVCCFEMV